MIASPDFMLRVVLIPHGMINHGEDKPSCIRSEKYPIPGRLAEKQRLTQACSVFEGIQEPFEGFGGKRALGFLLKIELCRKRSKFHMQFCLGALNNVLYVFLLKFSSFTRYYVCKKACICGLIST